MHYDQDYQPQVAENTFQFILIDIPDSKVHGANMGPTWVLSAPDGPHVGLMNFAIRVDFQSKAYMITSLQLEIHFHYKYMIGYASTTPPKIHAHQYVSWLRINNTTENSCPSVC